MSETKSLQEFIQTWIGQILPLLNAAPQLRALPSQNSADPASTSGWDTELASQIDHTLLRANASESEVQKLCDEARTYRFKTVCVNSSRVALAARLLEGSSTVPIAVVGFPLGACDSKTKAFEAREAVAQGAREIDMVINIGALQDLDYALVYRDIVAVVQASHPYPVKVILETSQLTRDQKIVACVLSKAAGAAFVKTSTGFGGGGATVEDIHLMRQIVGTEMGVKASGGIRTREDALNMIRAGANRIGASSSVAIVTAGAAGTATAPKANTETSPKSSGY